MIVPTPLWVHNLNMALANDDYRSAKCILLNQLAGYPSLNWRRYVSEAQAARLDATVVPVVIESQSKNYLQPAKPKNKRKAS